MGVTYKLKQEVIDFIVQKKQADPSLSCRKLVTLLEDAFKIDVSKSSVNAVIKEFNLSNPVGRRADKAPKNFFIPSERKQQLLAQVVPFLPQAAVPAAPAEEVVQPIDIKEEVIYKVEEQTAPVTEVLPEVKEEVVHLAPDLIAPVPVVLKEKTQETIDWSDEQGPLVENMGFFFVRTLMQDILRRPLLGQTLSQAAGMGSEDAVLLEAAVFLKAMGCSSVGDIHGDAHRSLAMMFEADPKGLEDVLGRFFGKNISLTALSVALETELGTAFVRGAFLKCLADTGHGFYLSADLGTFLASPEGVGGCPMFKAIEEAVDCLLVGRKPLVFDLPQGLDASAREFLVFIDGKSKDRFDKIELWSDKSKELWSSLLKAGQKPKFIASMSPGVGLHVDFEKIGELCPYDDVVFADQYGLEEGLYVIDQERNFKLRAILVAKQGQEKKAVLLTNILEKDFSKEEILEKYLENKGFFRRKPHFDGNNRHESHEFMGNITINDHFLNHNSTLDAIFGVVFGFFETYAAGVLCAGPEAREVFRTLYPAAARIRLHKDRIYVRFEAERNDAHFLQLQAAVERAHAFAVRDRLGRRICFSLVPFGDK